MITAAHHQMPIEVFGSLAFEAMAEAPAWGSPERQARRTTSCAANGYPEGRSGKAHRGDPAFHGKPPHLPPDGCGPQRRTTTGRARETRNSRRMNIRRGVLWDSSAILASLDADDADHGRAVAIARQIASKDWSLCDAISFAVLDARRIRRAFTFDRHFLQYGRIEILGLSRRFLFCPPIPGPPPDFTQALHVSQSCQSAIIET
jgi:hypothetical protein